MSGSSTVKHSTRSREFVLRGANADLWKIATSPRRLRTFEKHLDTLAEALGGDFDSNRVDASKSLIGAVWSRWPMLGPYPFLQTLSRFEFDRVFYKDYRDHVCHQLKVYLLGLGVFDNCPEIQQGLDKAGLAADFDRVWAVTSVFHDVGYVIEADHTEPGKAQWARLQDEYEAVMETPFSLLRAIELDKSAEHAIQGELDIRAPTLGASGDIAAREAFEHFKDAAARAGLAGRNIGVPAIEAYYKYAQENDPNNRPKFRDHGVASALLLMRHWNNYDRYINAWLRHESELSGRYPDLDLSRLTAVQSERTVFFDSLCRAAGAMSVHNVTPSQWSEKQHRDAHSAGVHFEGFRIWFDDQGGKNRANPLAFLLGLVDTLQDWDRPTFDGAAREKALHAEDLRVLPRDGKVSVYVRADDLEFRNPATSTRSRYGYLRGVLESYLDPKMIGRLLEWGSDLGSGGCTDVATVVEYVNSSHLGHRLRVSEPEKRAIAMHCVKANFWLATDSVFLEAGTLPIHMIFELYRKRLAEQPQPKRLITNNLACALLAVMNQVKPAPSGSASATYPEDEPSNLFVLGGRVVNDYAGTIPGGANTTVRTDPELWDENLCGSHAGIQRCLEAAEVNHVVMMVTRLDSEHGPCAASEWMRRYKKQMLRYAAEHSSVRLSILGEADKLFGRQGHAADHQDGPERYWARLLGEGRVSIVCARGADIREADLALVKRTLDKLARAGAKVTLLGPTGDPESHDLTSPSRTEP